MNIDRKLFKTGNALIDQQHEAYLDLVEKFFNFSYHKADLKTLKHELNKVFAYAVEHFDTEEYLMRSVQYPWMKEHCDKHGVFRDNVDSFSAELQNSDVDLDLITVRLAKLLVEWFADQVQIDDRKLAGFLKQHAHKPLDTAKSAS